MTQSNFTIITRYGREWQARKAAGQVVPAIDRMVFGDGDRVPTGGEAALLNEVHREGLSNWGILADETAAFFDAYLSAEIGGFVIREHGLLDASGGLIAIGRRDPGIPKADPATGAADDFTYRIDVFFTDLEALVVAIDPVHGLTAERRVDTATGLAGGGDLSADRTLVTDWSNLGAAAGVFEDGDTLNLRKAGTQWAFSLGQLGAWLRGFFTDAAKPDTERFVRFSDVATTALRGIVELATTPEAEAGIDTTRATHAAGVLAAVAKRLKGADATVPVPAGGWNDVTDWGVSPILLQGNSLDGPVLSADNFYCWNIHYGAGDNLTQVAIPYGTAGALARGWYCRGRFNGVWSSWRRFSPDATTAGRGLVELATVPEALAGTDAERAVTPAGLAAAHVLANIPIDGRLSSPPGAPVDGTQYLVAPGATGEWAGRVNQIARRRAGQWVYETPRAGRVTSRWTGTRLLTERYDGAAWAEWLASETAAGPVRLGTQTEVDAGTAVDIGVSPATIAKSLISHRARLGTDIVLSDGVTTTIPFGQHGPCEFATISGGVYTFTKAGNYDIEGSYKTNSDGQCVARVYYRPAATGIDQVMNYQFEVPGTPNVQRAVALYCSKRTIIGVQVGDQVRLAATLASAGFRTIYSDANAAPNHTEIVVTRSGVSA